MRLALPKGRLWENVGRLLANVGITFRFECDRDYSAPASEPGLSGKLIKARAVPQMVALGNFEAGFCGLDLVMERDYDQVVPVLDLGLNRVELVVAVARGQEGLLACPPRRPLLLATEYERLADRWANRHGLAHITVQTWGSTEAYLPEDADVVFDCVETGRTMAANHLVVVDRIMASTTWLVANRDALCHLASGAAIRSLAARLQAVTAESTQ